MQYFFHFGFLWLLVKAQSCDVLKQKIIFVEHVLPDGMGRCGMGYRSLLVNGTVKVCVPYDHSLEYHPGGCLNFMFI